MLDSSSLEVKQRRKALALSFSGAAVLFSVVSAFAQPAPVANSDWPYYGNDPGGMRFVDLDQIRPSNVANLKPAWIFHTNVFNDNSSFEAQPIVVGGVMYITSPHDHVFALDAATGNLKWTYNPTDMPPLSQLSISSGQCNRGAAVGSGNVFVARLDANLIAINAATGKESWRATVDRWQDGYTETMAPLYVNGMVVVGTSGGEFLRRGHVTAYDAVTGRQLWRFYTVPGPGEYGNNTWAGESWRSGGATVWSTPVADLQLGLLYVTTGQPAPDENGSQRAGDNLFSDSIIALNLTSGQRVWHFQETHHDIWDYDSVQPAHLFTMMKNGQPTPAIGHANKAGFYYLLDRRTGAPLIPVNETPVPVEPAWQHPSPTQPIPATDPLIPHTVDETPATAAYRKGPIFSVPQEIPMLINPGYETGPQWAPSSYSPRTGMTYIAAGGYDPWLYHAIEPVVSSLGSTGQHELPGLNGIETYGLIDAVDTTTGKIAWQIRTPEKTVSGMVTAGDLVYYGEGNGRFNAASAKTGQVLWSYRNLGKGIGGANGSAAVYAAQGREFVVMAFGGNDPARIGGYSPTGDALIAFALPSTGDRGPHNVVTANPIQVDVGAIPEANLSAAKHSLTPGYRVVDVVGREQSYEPNNFVVMPNEKISVHLIVPGDTPTQGAVATSFAVQLPSGPFGLKGMVMPGKDAYFEFTAPAAPGLYDYFSPFRNQRALGEAGVVRVAPPCEANTTPCISTSGVLNAASQIAGAISPGEAILILGSGLGPATPVFNNPLPGSLGATLAGTQVLINGIPAVLLEVGSNEVAALVPYEIAGRSSTTVIVVSNGAQTPASTVSVTDVTPSIYTASLNGKGQALILNADNLPNSLQRPAARGSLVKIYVNGVGQTNPAGVDGQLSTPGSEIQPVAPTYVLIGGRRAEVINTTVALGLRSGVLQVQAMVPIDAPTGSKVEILFAAGNILSNAAATIAIQ